jgi:phosphoglycerate dehydrogenase-like enzyme
MESTSANCIILTQLAEEFAIEIARLADIPVKACKTTDAALAEYTNETVLFGNPQQIAEVLPEMPTIDWVQSSWAGVTPLLEYQRRDYVLTGVKDVFGPQMSEYVFGYLLAHCLKIFRRRHEQKKHHWYRENSGVLEGKCLGIMGTGSIGGHIAKTAKAFGMTVAGFSRSGKAVDNFDSVYPATELHEFLTGCDHLVSTLPDTPAVDNILDEAALARLPKHAYFVNVGRSNVVDDEALMAALRQNRLAGAALDVFDREPLPKDSPMWNTSNLNITAHIAAISHPMLLVPIFVENYQRYLNGEPLNYVIDFDAGY